MSRLILRIAAVAVTIAVVPADAVSQRVPRRPRLAAAADTNDATAYFQLGLDRVEHNADQAAAAFYWAARLDPLSAQTLYARSVALLLGDPDLLVRVVQRDARTLTSPAALAIDSLRFRAEMQDPFFHRGMDGLMLRSYARRAERGNEWLLNSERGGTTERARAPERFGEERDPQMRATLLYSDGLLLDALQYYGIALRNREADWIQAERARVFAETRQLDSARAALGRAIHLWRPATPDAPRHLHESRAAWEYALGRLHEDRRETAAAAAAYADALVHDPAYQAAHLRLAALSLQARDTSAALGRLAQATADADVPYFALTVAGTLYGQLGRADSAIAVLRRATQAEPWASAGWLMLARELVATRQAPGAMAAYERYLALAPRAHSQRPAAERALASLRAAN